MAVRMVTVINPNGTKARVAETSRAAAEYRRAPSELAERPVNLSAAEGGAEPPPAKNASTQTWQDYATRRGMPAEEAADKSRDELVNYFTEE